jgi:DNA-binding response OmpR family regulator
MTEVQKQNGIKILVVEDSRTQAEYLRHILEKEGYRVILAADSREALGLILADQPAIILTDIVMPEMNGYELCSRIKSDPRMSHIPVILVTQLFDPVDIIHALEAGADDFIIKPLEPRHVISRISHILAMMAVPDPDGKSGSIELTFSDGTHVITASRLKILTILLSTYDLAIKKTAELQEAHEHVAAVNVELQKTIEKLDHTNRELVLENTERQRVEQELARANKKLQLMTSITRHNLINQLTALHENLELATILREKEPAKAWTNIARAEEIVRQTINTVKFTEEYQKIGINTAVLQDIRTVINDSMLSISPGNVRLENDVPEGIEVSADPLFGKVFVNLMNNAIRFRQKITKIRFSCVQQQNTMCIVCEDDGRGILPDEKEAIFSYEHGMNTGFGLFLSREILAISGITIRENGQPSAGARFEICWPPGLYLAKKAG